MKILRIIIVGLVAVGCDPSANSPSLSRQGIDIAVPPRPTTCVSRCDCNQGQLCVEEACVTGIAPAYCCDKTGCASGESCVDAQGAQGICLAAAPDWDSIGFGGMGVFSSIAVHPTKKRIMLAGADVGGIYTSTDGGTSWVNTSHNLDSLQIQAIAFDGGSGHTAYLATAGGLYKSVGSTYDDWELLPNTGFQAAVSSPFSTPLQSVAIDPLTSTTIWVGVGEEVSHSRSTGTRDDPYQVYRSADGGTTWTAMLAITGATVWDIQIHPTAPNRVWVATTRGLYYTFNSGKSWYEIGIASPRQTSDGGSSWTTCGTGDCRSLRRSLSGSATAPFCRGSLCLPVISTALLCSDDDDGDGVVDSDCYEQHPNVHDLEWVNNQLNVTIFDRGHANDAPTGCNSDAEADDFADTGLDYFRGGPYRSSDGGLKFTWLLKPAGTPILDNIIYRCDETGGILEKSMNFPELEVNPYDPDVLLMGGLGRRAGVYLIDLGSSSYERLGKCANAYDCYEGGHNLGISGDQNGPRIYRLAMIDWSFFGRHSFLFTHPRGVTKGAMPTGSWAFDHLFHDAVDTATTPYGWSSSGLDNACVTGGIAELTSTATTHLFAGAADGGVFRSGDDGTTWQKMSDLWPITIDDTDTLAVDPINAVVYASNTQATNSSVLKSLDGGESWTVVGGYGCTGCASTTGGLAGIPYRLAADNSSSQERLLAGTTTAGVFLYDAAISHTTDDPWVSLTDCPISGAVTSIVTSSLLVDAAGTRYALLTVNDAGTNEGVYLLNLSLLTCSNLSGGSAIVDPSALALAATDTGELSLVVGAECSGIPCVLQTAFDPDSASAVNWSETMRATDFEATTSDRYATLGNFTVASMAVNPANPQHVVVGLRASPYFDNYVSRHLYVSVDGGQTFRVDAALEESLSNKGVWALNFSDDGSRLYAATSCSSLFRLEWPY